MTRRPIIGQLLHGLRVGGAEVLVARLVRRLRERYDFRFACLDEIGSLGDELAGEGFPVALLDRRPGLDWKLPLRLARWYKSQRLELVHAHQYTPFFWAMTARFFGAHPPVLFTEHGRWLPDYPRRKRILANRLLLRSRDRFVGVGAVVQQALIDNEGLPRRRVKVLYNGIDLTPYRRGETGRAQLRSELGYKEQDILIVQVARLVPIKDHLTAVRAFAAANHRDPRLRLLLVGEGPEELAVRNEIARLSLGNSTQVLGLRGDVPRLLAAADVFLLTSENEGIPLTVIEAMAASLPVVSTNAGGVGEVVVDGVTGLLAPVGDAEKLASHLTRLANDVVLAQSLGAAGRARAFAHFDEEQMLAAYDRNYREMLR